jgi:1-acyl-sn-glycerol-3-phosphate acyltransferase
MQRIEKTMRRVIFFCRAAFATLDFYAFAFFLTALGAVLGILAAAVKWQAFIRVGTVVWGHMAFLLMGRLVHVYGRFEPPADAPLLVVANHASLFDIPALMAAVPGIAIVGRDYLTRIPLFGALLGVLNYVPIDTASPRSARAALEQAARTARSGIPVGIFPEGTRTETGEVQPLKRGFVHILRKSGSALLPVRIDGTFALKPKGKLYLSPQKKIEVTIGTPVAHEALACLSDEEIMKRVREMLVELGGVTA